MYIMSSVYVKVDILMMQDDIRVWHLVKKKYDVNCV